LKKKKKKILLHAVRQKIKRTVKNLLHTAAKKIERNSEKLALHCGRKLKGRLCFTLRQKIERKQ
jgi:hypothetical protein